MNQAHLSIQHKDIAKLVAFELFRQTESPSSSYTVPSLVQEFIGRQIQKGNAVSVIEELCHAIEIRINFDALQWVSEKRSLRAWNEQALKLLVARRAHFSMLKALFPALTKQRLANLRSKEGYGAPSLIFAALKDAEVERIYRTWQTTRANNTSDLDAWVEMAINDSLSSYELASMHFIVNGRS